MLQASIPTGKLAPWYAMHMWLQNYAYRVSIGWWAFVLSGILAILVAFFTISFQGVRASLANPVRSLEIGFQSKCLTFYHLY